MEHQYYVIILLVVTDLYAVCEIHTARFPAE